MGLLPIGYKQLEYIESTGTQYIDTGVNPTQESSIDITIEFTHEPSSGQEAIYGSRNSDSNQFWAYYRYNSDGFAMRFGSRATNYLIYTPAIGIHQIQQIGKAFNVDGEKVYAPESTFSSGTPMYLFAVNNSGAVQYAATFRLSNCKIADAGYVLREFVPCINPSGEVGLYDLATLTFYGNAGTGFFVAGPEVMETPDTPNNFYQLTSVVLQWSTVSCDGYKLYKNGSLLTTTQLNQYVDSAVANGQDIEYSITAYRGNLESEPQTIQVSVREGYTILTPVITSAFFQ